MKIFTVFFLLLLLFSSTSSLFCSSAIIKITPYTGTEYHSLYVSPVVYNHTLIGPFNTYDQKSTGHFSIAQWMNPEPFVGTSTITPPNPACNISSASSPDFASQPIWSIETGSLRVCALNSLVKSNRLLVQLAQNGGNSLKCGNEFDLFLSPNSFGTYPVNNNRANDNQNKVTLDQIKSIDFSFGVDLVYSAVKRRCSAGGQRNCGPSGAVDYGYITLGIPFSNPTAKQTIFYQILLFDTRSANTSPSCGSSFDTCSPTSGNEGNWYFASLPTLGVNFNIGTFLINNNNQEQPPCLQQGTRSVWYNSSTFDQVVFLNTLRKSVADAASKFGADGELSHWEIQGWYLGSGMQGDVVMTTTVGFDKFEVEV